ncbi:YbaN family protein [Ilumatobacter fluminis]|nr:YbaN family protein [Ilumatobacter fluminis]
MSPGSPQGSLERDELALAATPVVRSRLARALWAVAGLVCVGLGLIGVVVPGLPTTGFMILAAAAFSRSSPRLEQWVLGLPKVGPAVQAYRAGLGMPMKAKVTAIAMMTIAIAISAFLLDSWVVRGVIIAAGVIGTVVILRTPTRRDDPIIAPPEQG